MIFGLKTCHLATLVQMQKNRYVSKSAILSLLVARRGLRGHYLAEAECYGDRA
jgi:hypothetical protein